MSGRYLELCLQQAESSPSEKQKEPTGADPYAVLVYGSQHFVTRLAKGKEFAF